MTCYEKLPFHLLDYFSAYGARPEDRPAQDRCLTGNRGAFVERSSAQGRGRRLQGRNVTVFRRIILIK